MHKSGVLSAVADIKARAKSWNRWKLNFILAGSMSVRVGKLGGDLGFEKVSLLCKL